MSSKHCSRGRKPLLPTVTYVVVMGLNLGAEEGETLSARRSHLLCSCPIIINYAKCHKQRNQDRRRVGRFGDSDVTSAKKVCVLFLNSWISVVKQMLGDLRGAGLPAGTFRPERTEAGDPVHPRRRPPPPGVKGLVRLTQPQWQEADHPQGV